jgi:hypothetical protein
MPSFNRFPRVLRLLALVPALALAACGLTVAQRSAVGTFAGASAASGEFAASELPHMREADMNLNAARAVLRGKTDLAKLAGAFTPEVIAVRVAAAEALQSYGRLLQALVEDTQQAQLAAASSHFVASFKNVAGKSLSDGQYQALGTAVEAIGGFIVEHEKKEALLRIVPQVKPDVDRLCDLFIADFSGTSLQLGQQLAADIDALTADLSIALAELPGSFSDRSFLVRTQLLVDREGVRARDNSVHAKDTFTSLKQANAQLANVLENETASIEDIVALAKQVQAWANARQALGAQ